MSLQDESINRGIISSDIAPVSMVGSAAGRYIHLNGLGAFHIGRPLFFTYAHDECNAQ